MPDYFDVVDKKLEEAESQLTQMGQTIIHPRHRDRSSHLAAMLSCPNTIVHHNWHEPFNSALNAFLSATRSVPDVITNRFGYDDYPRNKSWLKSLDPQEQQRRKDFRRQFKPHFTGFEQHPLNAQRKEVQHGSGFADWEVRVQGRWGTIHIGGPLQPLPQTESPPIIPGEDPALAFLSAQSTVQIEPMHTDFWWVIPQPGGSPTSLPLFPTCQGFLAAAQTLVGHARQLFQAIHNGHPFKPPPR